MTEYTSPDPPILRPKRSLADRIAIATGADAAGDDIDNGRAVAILLTEGGCNVDCVDLQMPSAERTVQTITDDGNGAAIAIQPDASVEAGCQGFV